MPINKKESLLYSLLMCFTMVLWMSIYNVALHTNEISLEVLKEAWLGLPMAYVVALLFDLFLVSKLAKGFAFSFLVKPEDKNLRKVLVISTCMVIPMVIIMSMYGAIEACLHSGTWNQLGMIWVMNIPMNFIMALPFQLLIAGPLVRYIFRKNFPIGVICEI